MEIIALLTTAKEAGFETGTIVSIAVIAVMLRRDVTKILDKQVDKIVKAIGAHNDRLNVLETDVKEIKTKLNK